MAVRLRGARRLGRLMLCGVCLRSLAHPRSVLVRVAPRLKPLAIARAIALYDGPEFIPVDWPEVPMLCLFVVPESRIGKRETNRLRLRHREIDEALAKLVVRLPLHAPANQLGCVWRIGVARAEHHERRPPPAVHCVLSHCFLRRRAARERGDDLVALLLVEILLLAVANNCAGIRTVRRLREYCLIQDCHTVDEPSNHAHVCPRQRGIIEAARVLRLAVEEPVNELGAADPKGFRTSIEETPETSLVLNHG